MKILTHELGRIRRHLCEIKAQHNNRHEAFSLDIAFTWYSTAPPMTMAATTLHKLFYTNHVLHICFRAFSYIYNRVSRATTAKAYMHNIAWAFAATRAM